MQQKINVAGLVILGLAAFGVPVPPEVQTDLVAGLGALGCLINMGVNAWQNRQGEKARQRGFAVPGLLGVIAVLTVGVLVAASKASAAELVLSYPSVREDGSALALKDIAECRVVDVTATPEVPLVALKPPATTHTIPNSQLLSARRFQAYCIDVGGIESARSAVLTAQVNPAKSPGLSITFRAGAI